MKITIVFVLVVCSLSLSNFAPTVRGAPDRGRTTYSCWNELEWRIKQLQELQIDMFQSLSFVPEIEKLGQTQYGRSRFFCLLIDIYDIEDLANWLKSQPKKTLELTLNEVSRKVKEYGGQDGFLKLAKAAHDYFQFWIDADISKLPVDSSKRSHLEELWNRSWPVLSAAGNIDPSILIGFPFFQNNNLDVLFESSSISELSKHSGVPQQELDFVADTGVVKTTREAHELILGIINELLDKNFLGVYCTDGIISQLPERDDSGDKGSSCWPELKENLNEILVLSQEHPFVEESILMVANIKPSVYRCDGNLEWLVCEIKEAESLTGLTSIFPGTKEKNMKRDFRYPQEIWPSIGMEGITSLANSADKAIQLIIDIDFPNEFPITSLSRQELVNKMKEVIAGVPSVLTRGRSMDEDIEMIADALLGSASFVDFVDTLGIYRSVILLWKERAKSLPTWQKLLPHLEKLAELLDEHGLLDS